MPVSKPNCFSGPKPVTFSPIRLARKPSCAAHSTQHTHSPCNRTTGHREQFPDVTCTFGTGTACMQAARHASRCSAAPVRPTNTSLALLKPKRVVPKKPLGLLTASILSGRELGPGGCAHSTITRGWQTQHPNYTCNFSGPPGGGAHSTITQAWQTQQPDSGCNYRHASAHTFRALLHVLLVRVTKSRRPARNKDED